MNRHLSHYDVLGVEPDASIEQIRAAHRALARQYHPDHRGASPSGGSEAARIYAINEAWRVLGDRRKRAEYDRTLPDRPEPEWSPFPVGTEPEPPDGFAEWYADADRRQVEARTVRRSVRSPRAPSTGLLIGLGVLLLAGVLLIAALAGTDHASGGARLGVGSCVRILDGPRTIPVTCDSPNDGRVVGFVNAASLCPSGSRPRRLDPNDVALACLVPTPGQ